MGRTTRPSDRRAEHRARTDCCLEAATMHLCRRTHVHANNFMRTDVHLSPTEEQAADQIHFIHHAG